MLKLNHDQFIDIWMNTLPACVLFVNALGGG